MCANSAPLTLSISAAPHYYLLWLQSFHLLVVPLPLLPSWCSEEVFDFSAGQMTQTKTLVMKDTMCVEFSKVFQLCSFVLVSGVYRKCCHGVAMVKVTLV